MILSFIFELLVILSHSETECSGSSFTCTENLCKCGSDSIYDSDSIYSLTGSFTQIQITKSQLTIILNGISKNGGVFIVEDQSEVEIQIKGENNILNTENNHAGIECIGNSSITISSFNNDNEKDILNTKGGKNSPGIGIGHSSTQQCKAIIINGGNITSSATTYGSGIGLPYGSTSYSYYIENMIVNGGFIRSIPAPSNGGGIGGYNKGQFGNITINGGFLDLIGKQSCPCINGGESADSIVINGGQIRCFSKATGIGPGNNGFLKQIIINGGEIDITTESGAGIGSGTSGGSRNHVDRIIINGGNITTRTNSSSMCAGIGGCGSKIFDVRYIEINGGRVNTTADKGAGIGTGSSSLIEEIRITGGEVFAESKSGGSGIGSGIGSSVEGTAYCRLINISGGTVHAVGRTASGIGAGIGDGYKSNISCVGTILITNGTVDARNVDNTSAGIGGGNGNKANSSPSRANVNNITIAGGKIHAEGLVGIGASVQLKPTIKTGCVDYITIDGGEIDATGKIAGIGAGMMTKVTRIEINGGEITATSTADDASLDAGSGIGGGANVTIGEIAINGGTIMASSSNFGAGIGVSSIEGANSLIKSIRIAGGNITAIGKSKSAGIGAGESTNGSCLIETIEITGGRIRSDGEFAPGIGNGVGDNSTVLNLILKYLSNTDSPLDVESWTQSGEVSAIEAGNIEEIGSRLKCDSEPETGKKRCIFNKFSNDFEMTSFPIESSLSSQKESTNFATQPSSSEPESHLASFPDGLTTTVTPQPSTALPVKTPKPLFESTVSVIDDKIDTSVCVDKNTEYVATIEKESKVKIDGKGSDTFFLNVKDKVEIEETEATFGIKIDNENKNPTVVLNQQTAKMNIKGSGSLTINASPSISSLELGDILVSNDEKINLQIEEKVTTAEFSNLEMFGDSELIFNDQKNSPIQVKNIKVNQGAESKITNVVAKESMNIRHNATIQLNRVVLKNVKMNIFFFSSNLIRTPLTGRLEDPPSQIMMKEGDSNEIILEEETFNVASSSKEDFKQCEKWKESIKLSETHFKSADCKDEKGMRILYLSMKEPTNDDDNNDNNNNDDNDNNNNDDGNDDNKGSKFPIGAIIGIVVAVVVVVAVIIIILIVLKKKKKTNKNNSFSEEMVNDEELPTI